MPGPPEPLHPHTDSTVMSKRGRPVKGAAFSEDVPGSEVARLRLKVILQTLAGELSIEQACGVLSVNRSRFHALRRAFLAGAAGLLEPRQPGPARYAPSAEELETRRLRDEVARLKFELCATQVREELALVMPRLMNRRRRAHKKNDR